MKLTRLLLPSRVVQSSRRAAIPWRGGISRCAGVGAMRAGGLADGVACMLVVRDKSLSGIVWIYIGDRCVLV